MVCADEQREGQSALRVFKPEGSIDSLGVAEIRKAAEREAQLTNRKYDATGHRSKPMDRGLGRPGKPEECDREETGAEDAEPETLLGLGLARRGAGSRAKVGDGAVVCDGLGKADG